MLRSICFIALLLAASAAMADSLDLTDPAAAPVYTGLHSNPGAAQVIYLDFTGSTTTSTSWNSSYTNGASITTPAWGTETQIKEIWERVAEDFAPFNVDVTTDANSKARASLTGSVRVAIGGSAGDWYTRSAGGVAYLYSFGLNTDTPVFVFPSNLSNSPKYIAEAISHEVGHSFGLEHDGRGTTEYYRGANGWAPIMGAGYDQPLTQWSRGEYDGATNTQDDLAFITNPSSSFDVGNYYGVNYDFVSYKADDYGNTFSDAGSLPLTNGVFTLEGLIEQNTDVDMFKFTLDYDALLTGNIFSGIFGDYSADTPATAGANLDILAKLYYGADNFLLRTFDPLNTLGISFGDLSLLAGDYYLSIEGTGNGFYSDYGSLGTYLITGTYEYLSSETPEPATMLILGLGLAGLGLARRKK